jgi:hypothetical protein
MVFNNFSISYSLKIENLPKGASWRGMAGIIACKGTMFFYMTKCNQDLFFITVAI